MDLFKRCCLVFWKVKKKKKCHTTKANTKICECKPTERPMGLESSAVSSQNRQIINASVFGVKSENRHKKKLRGHKTKTKALYQHITFRLYWKWLSHCYLSCSLSDQITLVWRDKKGLNVKRWSILFGENSSPEGCKMYNMLLRQDRERFIDVTTLLFFFTWTDCLAVWGWNVSTHYIFYENKKLLV